MNQNAPLVTVYITNHNYGRFIKQSIDSVLAQIFQDYEIIIIDDGSKDNSFEVIDSYKQHPKINIIYQQNLGLNVTNNIALRVARGKYIMRLDADDYLDKNALLVMSNVLEQDDELGLVFPDYYMVDIDGNFLSLERRHSFDQGVTLFDQPAHGACTLVRREFLLAVGGYNEGFSCQDGYDLWVRFVGKYRVTNVNLPLFYYRQHGSNLTRNENRILDTRSVIKQRYVDEYLNPLRTVAILPVRGSKTEPGSFALEPLEDRLLIDWLIDQALQSTRMVGVVITSPDESIEAHVRARYESEPRVIYVTRSPELARLNVGLIETIKGVLTAPAVQALRPEAVLRMSIEFPFVTGRIMDDAVNTLCVFKGDSLISVRPETSMFYQHNGQGLRSILNQNRFTHLEREALYRNAGGLVLTDLNLLHDQSVLIGGKVGHIVIDQRAAHGVHSAFDLTVARFLATQSPTGQQPERAKLSLTTTK